jgi:hypothetical protein
MTQYVVPKFIEHKAKIVGPLTFQQFIYIGIAGALAFVFYYTLPFVLFFMLSAIIFAGAAALAFGQIGGRPIPIVMKNFVFFSFAPKMYLWKRKTGLPPKIAKEEPSPKKTEIPKTTKIGRTKEKGKLKDLSMQIETRYK